MAKFALLILAVQMVVSQASTSSPSDPQSEASHLDRGLAKHTEAAYGGAVPRRMAYPSVGQLLREPDSISEVDVIVSEALHKQCVDILMHNFPKESALVRTLELNLTKWNLQSATTNVDKSQNKISIVLLYGDGSQTVYTEQFRSKSFGCMVDDPKYDGIMTKAQSVIDGLNYDTAPDFTVAPPERDPESFEVFSKAVLDPRYNSSRAFLIFQKGKLVWEKYAAGGDKDYAQTLEGDGGHGFSTMWPMVRNLEGKFDLDKWSFCPELKELEKRARNMTARNLISHRIGRPIEKAPVGKLTKPKALYDAEKLLWVVADKANYAAVVPSSYGAGTVPLEWSKQLYSSPGDGVLLQRELRYTFPASTDGFAEYAAYPWTHFFSQMAASSFTLETDASGTFVGHQGVYANARDFLKLGALMVQQGKWHGKQLVPAEYIERNMNSPFGPDQSFNEGWHSFTFPGVPKMLYIIGEHGGLYLCPELEIAVFDFQVGNDPKRLETIIFMALYPFMKQQVVAWSTTTTTATTSSKATTTATTGATTTAVAAAAPAAPSPAASSAPVAASTPASTNATSPGGDEQTSFTTRNAVTQWMLIMLITAVKFVLAKQNDQ